MALRRAVSAQGFPKVAFSGTGNQLWFGLFLGGDCFNGFRASGNST